MSDMPNMNKNISLDDVIAQLRNSKMERVVEASRIKGGQAAYEIHLDIDAPQESCHP